MWSIELSFENKKLNNLLRICKDWEQRGSHFGNPSKSLSCLDSLDKDMNKQSTLLTREDSHSVDILDRIQSNSSKQPQ